MAPILPTRTHLTTYQLRDSTCINKRIQLQAEQVLWSHSGPLIFARIQKPMTTCNWINASQSFFPRPNIKISWRPRPKRFKDPTDLSRNYFNIFNKQNK